MRSPVRPEPRQAKRTVGRLGWTAEELQKYKRTKKWPARAVEVPGGPPGLTLNSLPSEEYSRGYVAALRQRGAKGKIAEDIALILKLLDETGGNVEQARTRFIIEQSRARFIVEPPRARWTVRSTRTALTFPQTGKRVIDLTPQVRSVLSKRFTRAMKEIRKIGSTNQRSS
jgi:hypothetical protein